MKSYEAMAGEHVDEAAKTICRMATEAGEPVQCDFNEIVLIAKPGEDPANVAERYSVESRLRSEEYAKSPAGIAAAQRAEEARKVAEASAAEGIKPFSVIDQDGWDKTVAANTDGYGACGIRYAARWAHMMEQLIPADFTPAQAAQQIGNVAQRCSHEADTEGITGFMYGCAVGILAKVWKHGEALRRWHNKETQIGTEGDRANETGGVLNPAVLSIG